MSHLYIAKGVGKNKTLQMISNQRNQQNQQKII